jgi:hypothetical protein
VFFWLDPTRMARDNMKRLLVIVIALFGVIIGSCIDKCSTANRESHALSHANPQSHAHRHTAAGLSDEGLLPRGG